MSTIPRITHGHQAAEAFCLMWYACRDCGHRERIWNSRDGVTPFCMGCPSCGQPSMAHVDWNLDQYAPNHRPALGQRIWKTMTIEYATALAKRALDRLAAAGRNDLPSVTELAKDYYNDGHAPMLAIHGYAEVDQ